MPNTEETKNKICLIDSSMRTNVLIRNSFLILKHLSIAYPDLVMRDSTQKLIQAAKFLV